MATKSFFTRSNVNSETLQISEPGHSSFDHYHKHHGGLRLGRFTPVDVTPLMPKGVLTGNSKAEYTLDTISTPEIGPIRLDQHVFAVSARRINSDWRKLIEGRVELKPQFQIDDLFDRICNFLWEGKKMNEVLRQAFVDPAAAVKTYRLDVFYSAPIRQLSSIVQTGGDYGYLKDMFAMLYKRINLREIELGSSTGSFAEALDQIHYILEPWFGESSVLDNLKYPILNYYGSQMECAKLYGETIITSTTNFAWASFFRGGVQYTGPSQSPVYHVLEKTDYRVPEDQLRVVYAAWYDQLRNWHLEERKLLPDPDTWASASVLMAIPSGISMMQHVSCFLLDRFRTYGNDAYTTIQTDAAWRHVFVPIMDYAPLSIEGAGVSVVGDEYLISNLLTSVESSLFPQGLFRRDLSEDPDSAFRLDLITMKRTHMVQAFAAHDYYCPDTYAGQIYAHWRVEPNDLVGVSSQYIGGSESFITGDQLKTATGTEDTPAGTRTFSGGMSNDALVTFASGGDFVYLVTFNSLQLVPTYDAKDMHLVELSRSDLPFPEFANDTNVLIRSKDMFRGFEMFDEGIGYVPRFLQYRTVLDSAHGRYLRDFRSQIWLRDFYSLNGGLQGELSGVNLGRMSNLNIAAYALHVHPNTDAWLNKAPWDEVCYGKTEFNFSVDFPLPAAIDFF